MMRQDFLGSSIDRQGDATPAAVGGSGQTEWSTLVDHRLAVAFGQTSIDGEQIRFRTVFTCLNDSSGT
jgi:hypothetical protein